MLQGLVAAFICAHRTRLPPWREYGTDTGTNVTHEDYLVHGFLEKRKHCFHEALSVQPRWLALFIGVWIGSAILGHADTVLKRHACEDMYTSPFSACICIYKYTNNSP